MKNLNSPFEIILTNTLTNKKEPFIPASHRSLSQVHNNDQINMYVCGITPYDYAHLGHARCYVVFDVLYRLLTLFGYNVNYCRNFTDIDDKLINRAQKELQDSNKYLVIASKFIAAFEEDMAKLNCIKPKFEPRVTNHIPQIIKFIEGLINKGKAYVADGDVYFSIQSFPEYGKLSKRNLEDLKIGARIEVKEDKRNPLDFALWKHAKSGPGWESPWGFGRPGWHIECSTLAKEYLGETIDIHGGGMDLIFPHHENEIAQSEGLHDKEFAHYWIHNAFVTIDKEKMSKSLGNFVTLKDILNMYNPMVIRYYILIHHYRNPLDFTKEDIEGAEKSYRKIVKLFNSIQTKEVEELCVEEVPLVTSLIQALCDDLNISKFFGLIFENLKQIENDPVQAELIKSLIIQVLGLTLAPLPEKEVEITPEIQKLLDAREQARKDKNWALSDELRDKLKELGLDVHDKKLK